MTDQKAQGAGPVIPPLSEEVDESLHPLLQAIVDNIKIIVGVIAALILAVGGFAVYESVQASNLAASRAELAEISATPEAAQRVEQLTAFLSEAPESMRPGVRLELAAALSDAGEYQRAAELWDKVDAANLTVVAEFGKAAELSRADKHDEALAVLQGMRTDLPKAYRMLHLERLAYEAQAVEDWQTALEAWESLLTENEGNSAAFIAAKIKDVRARLDG